ncbi:hypothetical protein ACFL0Y_02230 [Patescibacteria group bacterium]
MQNRNKQKKSFCLIWLKKLDLVLDHILVSWMDKTNDKLEKGDGK